MAVLNMTADLSHLAAIRSFVGDTGRELGLSESLVWDLKLAVDEACTNIIKHAYGGRGGAIEIQIQAVEGGIEATVRDWGVPFQPETVPLPDLSVPIDQRPPGGLGIFLMHQVMDHLEYQFDPQQGNTLTMRKHFNRRQA